MLGKMPEPPKESKKDRSKQKVDSKVGPRLLGSLLPLFTQLFRQICDTWPWRAVCISCNNSTLAEP